MKRHANVTWNGSLKDGKGRIDSTQSGALSNLPISFNARFQDESGKAGTNPEELIAAAHAACFSMALSHALAQNGTPPEELQVKAVVEVSPKEGGGFAIGSSALTLSAKVPGLDEAKFREITNGAKEGCPVSQALKGLTITLDATLA